MRESNMRTYDSIGAFTHDYYNRRASFIKIVFQYYFWLKLTVGLIIGLILTIPLQVATVELITNLTNLLLFQYWQGKKIIKCPLLIQV